MDAWIFLGQKTMNKIENRNSYTDHCQKSWLMENIWGGEGLKNLKNLSSDL